MAMDNVTLTRAKIEFNEIERKAIQELITALEASSNAEQIQGAIYQIARNNEIKPPEFFKLLYRAILGTEKGPRLGGYIADIGVQKVTGILKEQLGGQR